MSKGHIEYIDGPMFSGKTTELFRRVKRYTVAQEQCIIMRYAKDTRYDSTGGLASSHDGEQLRAMAVQDPREVNVNEYNVVALDEAQFMGPDLAGYCHELAEAGKIVIVSGLSSCFQRRPWPEMLAVMAIAERVTRLDAICWHCHGPAQYSRRINVDNMALEDIGGTDKYVASCRTCWNMTLPLASLRAHVKLATHVNTRP